VEILGKCDQKYILVSALHYVLENFSDYILCLYLAIILDFYCQSVPVWIITFWKSSQFCWNHSPWGSGRAPIGKTILHIFILEKIFEDLLIQNHCTWKAYTEASWQSTELSFLKLWSPGAVVATIGKTIFTFVYMEKSFNFFLTRTTGPEKFKFTWNLSRMVQNHVYQYHSPKWSGGATIGKAIFICMFILEMSLKIFLSWSTVPEKFNSTRKPFW
jgi:hypothetical protein